MSNANRHLPSAVLTAQRRVRKLWYEPLLWAPRPGKGAPFCSSNTDEFCGGCGTTFDCPEAGYVFTRAPGCCASSTACALPCPSGYAPRATAGAGGATQRRDGSALRELLESTPSCGCISDNHAIPQKVADPTSAWESEKRRPSACGGDRPSCQGMAGSSCRVVGNQIAAAVAAGTRDWVAGPWYGLNSRSLCPNDRHHQVTMPESSTHHFGLLLRRHRLAAGLSQAELAERAGLSPDGIRALEAGRRATPRPYTVRALAEALALAEEDRLQLYAAAQRSPRHRGLCPSRTRRPLAASGAGSPHRPARPPGSSGASERWRPLRMRCAPRKPAW